MFLSDAEFEEYKKLYEKYTKESNGNNSDANLGSAEDKKKFKLFLSNDDDIDPRITSTDLHRLFAKHPNFFAEFNDIPQVKKRLSFVKFDLLLEKYTAENVLASNDNLATDFSIGNQDDLITFYEYFTGHKPNIYSLMPHNIDPYITPLHLFKLLDKRPDIFRVFLQYSKFRKRLWQFGDGLYVRILLAKAANIARFSPEEAKENNNAGKINADTFTKKYWKLLRDDINSYIYAKPEYKKLRKCFAGLGLPNSGSVKEYVENLLKYLKDVQTLPGYIKSNDLRKMVLVMISICPLEACAVISDPNLATRLLQDDVDEAIKFVTELLGKIQAVINKNKLESEKNPQKKPEFDKIYDELNKASKAFLSYKKHLDEIREKIEFGHKLQEFVQALTVIRVELVEKIADSGMLVHMLKTAQKLGTFPVEITSERLLLFIKLVPHCAYKYMDNVQFMSKIFEGFIQTKDAADNIIFKLNSHARFATSIPKTKRAIETLLRHWEMRLRLKNAISRLKAEVLTLTHPASNQVQAENADTNKKIDPETKKIMRQKFQRLQELLESICSAEKFAWIDDLQSELSELEKYMPESPNVSEIKHYLQDGTLLSEIKMRCEVLQKRRAADEITESDMNDYISTLNTNSNNNNNSTDNSSSATRGIPALMQ